MRSAWTARTRVRFSIRLTWSKTLELRAAGADLLVEGREVPKGIAMPNAAPDKSPAQLAITPCELRLLERAAGGMRFRGREIAVDVSVGRRGKLRAVDASSSNNLAEPDGRGNQSLAKRYCGDWRRAA